MKRIVATVGAALLLIAPPAFAHQLDEYLQATTISVEKNSVQAEIRLTPGVAVFPQVLAGIDTNADGVISTVEQKAYAERVLGDLSLTVGSAHLHPRFISWKFASVEKMKEGLGDIDIRFTAEVPHSGRSRKLIFENHHQSRIATYLVNCLVPSDPDIQITAQNRNYEQSHYELDYVQADAPTSSLSVAGRPDTLEWLCIAVLFLIAPLALLWQQGRTGFFAGLRTSAKGK